MNSYRRNISQITTDGTIVSVCSPRPSTSQSQNPNLSDKASEDVFSLLLEELNTLGDKLTSLEIEVIQHLNSTAMSSPRLRSSSRSRNEEYPEILEKKGRLVENLTETVKEHDYNKDVPDTANYSVPCYKELASLFEERCSELKTQVQETKAELKIQKNECDQLQSYIACLTSLTDKENNDQQDDVNRKELQKARKDLGIVLETLIPDVNSRNLLVSALSVLTEAYVNNLENPEDQFVEISPEVIKGIGFHCLQESCVIIPHPVYKKKFRLCVE